MRQGTILRPPVSKTGTLPTELLTELGAPEVFIFTNAMAAEEYLEDFRRHDRPSTSGSGYQIRTDDREDMNLLP